MYGLFFWYLLLRSGFNFLLELPFGYLCDIGCHCMFQLRYGDLQCFSSQLMHILLGRQVLVSGREQFVHKLPRWLLLGRLFCYRLHRLRSGLLPTYLRLKQMLNEPDNASQCPTDFTTNDSSFISSNN